MYFRILMLAVVLSITTVRAAEEYTPAMPNLKVNGEPLSGDAVKKIYDFWLKVYQAPGSPLSKEFLDKLASISRDQAVQHAAIHQYVERNKLALTPAQTKEDLEAFKADLTKQGRKFDDILKSRAKTEAEFMNEFALRAALTRAIKAETEKDAEGLKKAFEAEKEKLALRRPSQIRFSYEKTKFTAHNERTKDDARKQADFALERAKKGEDFATLAKQLSDDSVSAALGGDLGWIAPNFTPKPLAAAVYALKKVGDVADLIETEQGFHIVKLIELKSDEEEFKAFVKQRVYVKTLTQESTLAKAAKVEMDKPGEPAKPADASKTAESAKPADATKTAEPVKVVAPVKKDEAPKPADKK